MDVISSVSLSLIANSRIVTQFAPRPYYFASTKGNTDLVRTLDETIALVRGLEEQISTAGYKAVVLCDDAEGCIQAVESGKADVAAADRASLEYYIYESGSSRVTSLIPGQTQNTDIAVSRACDTALLAAMNNDIYSISEEDLAAYLSTGNLHSDRFSLAAFTRRHPVHAAVIVASAPAILAAVIFILLSRSAKERSAMQTLHNTQLQEALSIDREATAAKTTFLSNMPHDIRTPMIAVVGLTHLALEEDLGTIRSYLDKIDASSDFLLGLINDVLDMSKIESGGLTLSPEPLTRAEFADSIETVIRPLMDSRRLRFECRLDDGPDCILVDWLRFNQIFLNLLSNAAQYTPTGGQVFLVMEQRPAGESHLRFTVRDTGVGMSEGFLDHLYAPFSQEHSQLSGNIKGTGLGLSPSSRASSTPWAAPSPWRAIWGRGPPLPWTSPSPWQSR